eukprot:1911604-Rhodomonas_salina.1
MNSYNRIKKIGAGAMGCAHLISRKTDGAMLVVKEINVASLGEKERQEAMLEVEVHRQLRSADRRSLPHHNSCAKFVCQRSRSAAPKHCAAARGVHRGGQCTAPSSTLILVHSSSLSFPFHPLHPSMHKLDNVRQCAALHCHGIRRRWRPLPADPQRQGPPLQGGEGESSSPPRVSTCEKNPVSTAFRLIKCRCSAAQHAARLTSSDASLRLLLFSLFSSLLASSLLLLLCVDAQILDLFGQICLGMHHIHSLNILH